jgi:malate dehydrogenase (oxaloacetate-decarboxylating)(NADP+)
MLILKPNKQKDKEHNMEDNLDKAALKYHQFPKPGKMEIVAIKPLVTQRDLALAYSPCAA